MILESRVGSPDQQQSIREHVLQNLYSPFVLDNTGLTNLPTLLSGESLAEMTNLSSEGSELREGVQLPGDPADFSQGREHE